MLDITPDMKILDLGGGDGSHIRSIFPDSANITVSDVSEADLAQARKRYGFTTAMLSDSSLLPWADNEFDFCFCSSVIEHVTGPRNLIYEITNTKAFTDMAWRHQQIFAKEIDRVAKSFYVQTPYKYFIIESHTWLPMVIILLPRSWQIKLIDLFNQFWPKKTGPDFYLLDRAEMQKLFPQARIFDEKFLFLTKSLMAIKT